MCVDLLLRDLGADTVILAGVAGNICVPFSAHDAYMRDYRVIVPADCIASSTPEETESVLAQMQAVLEADITPSTALAREDVA